MIHNSNLGRSHNSQHKHMSQLTSGQKIGHILAGTTPTDAGTNRMFPHRPFSSRFPPKQSLRHRRRSRHLFRMGFIGHSFAFGWQFKSFWFLIGLRPGHVKFTHRRRSVNKHGGHVTPEDTGADCFWDLRAVLHSWDLYFYLSTSFVISLPFRESVIVNFGRLYSYSYSKEDTHQHI